MFEKIMLYFEVAGSQKTSTSETFIEDIKNYDPYYFKYITQATKIRNYWLIFTNRQQTQRSYH